MKKILISTTLITFSMLFIIFFAWDAGCFWSSDFKAQLKLAKQGDALSQSIVGDYYLFGRNRVRKDKKEAIYWLTKAAQQGGSEEQYYLGHVYYNYLQNDKKAIFWITKAARQGNLDAQCALANDYASDYGRAPKDSVRALYWLTKAAEQGSYIEQYNLGNMYYDGEGISKDNKKAFYWWTKAAEKGHSAAQDRLGNLYYDGIEIQKNRVKAAYWWKKAAEQGNCYAQSNLGMLYYDGIGVIQSYKFAYIWCSLAAKHQVSGSSFSKKRELAIGIKALSKKKLSPIQLVEAQEFVSTTQDKFFRPRH